MYIKDVITNLFNLEEERIEDLEVTTAYGKAFVLLSLTREATRCPHCHRYTTLVHDYRNRIIKHAVLTNMDTELIYRQRRMFCPDCRRAFPERNPFVATGRRVSNYTIIQVMDLLRDPRTTFTMAARATGLSVPTVQKIFDEHAGIRTVPFPEMLCIDEVYTAKYTQNVYSCVLVDFKSCQLFDLLPGRHKADLYSYFSSIPEETRDRVEYICIDMWETYRDAVHVFFRQASLCVDSFHVVSLVNRTFNSVRISVMNSFVKGSDEYYLLKKYHWLLSSRQSAVTSGRDIYLGRNTSYRCRGYIRPRDLLNIMLDISRELETAYVIKEGYLELNACSTAENAAARMESWLNYIERSGSPEFISTAATVRKWKQEILNSFNTFEGRRISNGPVESVNSRIKKIKSSANGYTVFERFRMRALYSLNQDSVIKF